MNDYTEKVRDALIDLRDMIDQRLSILTVEDEHGYRSRTPHAREQAFLSTVETVGSWGGRQRNSALAWVVECLRRLSGLLGLSDAERAFISDISEASLARSEAIAIAKDQVERVAQNEGAGDDMTRTVVKCVADTWDLLLVFADWLQDQQRHLHEVEMRRLVPEHGDVLVATLSESESEGSVEYQRVLNEINMLRLHLSLLGREVFPVVLMEGTSKLAVLPTEEMHRLGWMRVSDHDAKMAKQATLHAAELREAKRDKVTVPPGLELSDQDVSDLSDILARVDRGERSRLLAQRLQQHPRLSDQLPPPRQLTIRDVQPSPDWPAR